MVYKPEYELGLETILRQIYLSLSVICTLDDSHRTATSEVVQAIKSVKETIEDCI